MSKDVINQAEGAFTRLVENVEHKAPYLLPFAGVEMGSFVGHWIASSKSAEKHLPHVEISGSDSTRARGPADAGAKGQEKSPASADSGVHHKAASNDHGHAENSKPVLKQAEHDKQVQHDEHVKQHKHIKRDYDHGPNVIPV